MEFLDPKEVGKRIKYIRESKNLSIDDLAIMLGVNSELIHRWENGLNITLTTLRSLAKALNIRFETLVGKGKGVLHHLASVGVDAAYLSDIGDFKKDNQLLSVPYLVLTRLPNNPRLFRSLSDGISGVLILPDILEWCRELEPVKPAVRYVWVNLESKENTLGIVYRDNSWSLMYTGNRKKNNLEVEAGVVALIVK